MLKIRNTNFKSVRSQAIEAAGADLAQAFLENPDVEYATIAQAKDFCPSIVALGDMTDGEIDYLCQAAGVELVEVD